MDLNALRAASQAADELIKQTDEKIDLEPRPRLNPVLKPEYKPYVRPVITEELAKRLCPQCGQPTANKHYCSKKCTLAANRANRNSEEIVKSSAASRKKTYEERRKDKPLPKCEHRHCENLLTYEQAYHRELTYCSPSCAASERWIRVRENKKCQD
jgi:hypothetical protein